MLQIAPGLVGLALLLLVGCAAPAKFEIDETPHVNVGDRRSILNSNRISDQSADRLKARPDRGTLVTETPQSTDDKIAFAETWVATARRVQRREAARALAYYLSAAELCLRSTDESPMLRELYNLSCAEIAHLVHARGGLDPQGGMLVKGRSREFQLRVDATGGRVDPSRFDSLTPTARVDLGDLDELGGEVIQAGIGGSLVGYISKAQVTGDTTVMTEGLAMALTSVVEFPGDGQAELSIYDVDLEDDVTVAGRQAKLAANFAAPISRLASDGPRGNVGFRAMIRPAKFQSREGLFFLEPFREGKIPLIMVHGLTSAPRTWRWTFSPLIRDEKLRENYQLWIYRYPTGSALGATTRNFRRHLSQTMARYNPDGANPALNQTVLIGHSMGGLLSSAVIRSSGDKIWDQLFDRPIDELEVDEETRKDLREIAFFEAQPYISRVVFIATPHRGSEMATDPVGRVINTVIRIPSNLVQLKRPGVLQAMNSRAQSWMGDHATSIDSLKPDSWRLEILNSLPIREGVTYHSIIGDRGRGDTPDSTDGTVPYWSSHLEDAASEVIVPADHSAHRHPEAHAELRRILHEHLRAVGR